MNQREADIHALRTLRDELKKEERISKRLSSLTEQIESEQAIIQKQQSILSGHYDPFPHYLSESNAKDLEKVYEKANQKAAHRRALWIGISGSVIIMLLAIASVVFILKQPAESWQSPVVYGNCFSFGWYMYCSLCSS